MFYYCLKTTFCNYKKENRNIKNEEILKNYSKEIHFMFSYSIKLGYHLILVKFGLLNKFTVISDLGPSSFQYVNIVTKTE